MIKKISLFLFSFCFIIEVSFAQNNGQAERIDEIIARITPGIIEVRHHIHQNPELGNREFETAKLVAEHLRSLGFDKVTTDVAHTGVVGILKGGQPGPVVAVRADMDALPVTETTNLPFKSTVRTTFLGKEVGVMHACGHDIHTTVQLGVASVLAEMRDEFSGTVKFIFQPAEEGPPKGEKGGAPLMIKEGVLKNPRPEAIFALHSNPELYVGTVGYKPGPAMAAVDHFYITIKGKQSHGAHPHKGIDPIVTASQVVMALQTIRSRNLSPLEPSVITVGIIRGGERFNIIPGEVYMEGTVRTYNVAVQDAIERRMDEILKGITLAAGASYTFEYDRVVPATINNTALTRLMEPTLVRVLGKENAIMMDPVMGGEDFSYFAKKIPGFYYFLGTTAPGTESGGLHTPNFRGDDSAIPVGIRVMTNLVFDYLEKKSDS